MYHTRFASPEKVSAVDFAKTNGLMAFGRFVVSVGGDERVGHGAPVARRNELGEIVFRATAATAEAVAKTGWNVELVIVDKVYGEHFRRTYARRGGVALWAATRTVGMAVE